MRSVLTLLTLAVCSATAFGQYPPPVFVAADPPPVVTRAEFLAVEKRVKALEAVAFGENKIGPLSTPQPSAVATSVCGCKLVGSTCPTTGFCGGAGCPCTQGKLAVVPTLPAPGVAAPDPFVLTSGCANGRCMIPTTTAPTVGNLPYSLPQAGTRSSGTDQFQEPTYTGAGLIRLTGGTTDGCANGRCGVVESSRSSGWYLGKNLGRQKK